MMPELIRLQMILLSFDAADPLFRSPRPVDSSPFRVAGLSQVTLLASAYRPYESCRSYIASYGREGRWFRTGGGSSGCRDGG